MKERVRVFNKEHGWLSLEEAAQRVDAWALHAANQGGAESISNGNSNKVVLSLFDKTGVWSQPWEDAGYNVYRFDIQNDPIAQDVSQFSVEYLTDYWGDFYGCDVYAVLAAVPCTDFANSGARHFAAKDADGRTEASIELAKLALATVEYFDPPIWAIENPAGRIEKLAGLPPWRLSFDPHHFGPDPYTKKTILWGRFNADLPVAPVEPVEGSKMHAQYGGASQRTKNARSVTPEGFAYAFFMANNAADHPEMALQYKYDRLDPAAIAAALKAGLRETEIAYLVDDPYYSELDDDAGNAALWEAAAERGVDRSPVVVETLDIEGDAAMRVVLDALTGEDIDAADLVALGGKGFYDAALTAAIEKWMHALSAAPADAPLVTAAVSGVRIAFGIETAAFEDIGLQVEAAQVLRQAAGMVRAGTLGSLVDTNGVEIGRVERALAILQQAPVKGMEVLIAETDPSACALAIEAVAEQVAEGKRAFTLEDVLGRRMGCVRMADTERAEAQLELELELGL